MVTHEDDIAACAKRVIRMRDGLIIDDSPSPRMMAAQAALVGTAPIDGVRRPLGTRFQSRTIRNSDHRTKN